MLTQHPQMYRYTMTFYVCFVLSQGLSPCPLLCHQQDRCCERGRSERIEVRGELAKYEQEAHDQIGQELPNAARDAEPAHAA